jgi:hypothetical protein
LSCALSFSVFETGSWPLPLPNGLELTDSSASTSRVAKIVGMYHHIRLLTYPITEGLHLWQTSPPVFPAPFACLEQSFLPQRIVWSCILLYCLENIRNGRGRHECAWVMNMQIKRWRSSCFIRSLKAHALPGPEVRKRYCTYSVVSWFVRV